MLVARTLLLREADRAEPDSAETPALSQLLAMLGGLPLALVMTASLLKRNSSLGFGPLVEALRQHS